MPYHSQRFLTTLEEEIDPMLKVTLVSSAVEHNLNGMDMCLPVKVTAVTSQSSESGLEKKFPTIIQVLAVVVIMEEKIQNPSVISSNRKPSQSSYLIYVKN